MKRVDQRAEDAAEHPRASLFVLHVDDTLLLKLIVACITGLTILAVVIAVLTPIIINRLDDDRQRDTATGRAAAWAICARAQLDRAERHAVYQAPGITSTLTAAVQDLPQLQPVLAAADRRRLRNLDRIRQQLPILDCRPLLNGQQPLELDADDQAAVVSDFLKGRLDPTPELPPGFGDPPD
jgi:hypothetical protein